VKIGRRRAVYDDMRRESRWRATCAERVVLHTHYPSGTVSVIGRIVECRQRERGSNYFDLLRKARLQYGRGRYDIGAIFLGPVTSHLRRPASRLFRSLS